MGTEPTAVVRKEQDTVPFDTADDIDDQVAELVLNDLAALVDALALVRVSFPCMDPLAVYPGRDVWL